ncbi:hypothetical protein MBLNU459_g5380t1 [Dothideomycetes sp. NU459]
MADVFQQQSQAFLAWFRSRRTEISPKIDLADLRHRNAGRGVVALQDIDEEEELFSVSRADILTVENSDFTRNPHGKRLIEDLEDQWTSLIVVMIYEHLRGDLSPWKPYFDVLPSDFNTLMFWSDEELEQLQASAVRQKIGKAGANEMFEQNVLRPIRANQALFPNASSLNDQAIVGLAHRMGSTIMAYAFDLEKEESKQQVDEDGYASDEEDDLLPKGMVPMADMLNADADRNNARLFYGESMVTMKALKTIKAGEEIFNDYGPLPRTDLLRRYGYVTPNYTQYDVVEIPQELVIDTFRGKALERAPTSHVAITESLQCTKADMQEGMVFEKLAFLEEAGALEDGYDICRTPEDAHSPFPDELLLLLWTLNLPASEFKQMKEKNKVRKATLKTTDEDSVRFLGILREILDARLKQYPTTLDEDQSLVSHIDQNPPQNISDLRKTMALHVRLGEKQILGEALLFVIAEYHEAHQRHSKDDSEKSRGSNKRRRMA